MTPRQNIKNTINETKATLESLEKTFKNTPLEEVNDLVIGDICYGLQIEDAPNIPIKVITVKKQFDHLDKTERLYGLIFLTKKEAQDKCDELNANIK